MGLGDLGNAIVIIFIFVVLHMYLSLSIIISRVKNNWNEYKCKPNIMPFAFIFGHDTIQNFTECIKLNQVNFMSTFLEPIYGSLNYFAETSSVFTNIFEDLKMFGNNQNQEMSNLASTVRNRLNGLIAETNYIYINIIDTFTKLASSMTVLYYVLNSTIEFAKSAWNELPGTFLKIASP